uniref:AN1-type domain-containing protein n=1 Tax=Trichobilharzia regenti TaxID=157069 RepID=A0AA85J0G9_TRIRE|nr:unnamed protein product [Trichobilharzia regenti]
MKKSVRVGISIHDQHLLYSGIELLDQTVLSTANIGHGALLRLIVKLRTGPLAITNHSCKTSTPTINQNGHNNNNNNNNIGFIPCIPNTDHIEESQWLSTLLSSPLSQVATSTSASTIFLPSIYLPPGVDVNNLPISDKSEPTSNYTLTECYNNSDNGENVNYEAYDDEICQIAEFLGYAIDETEQYHHSFIEYPVVLNENQMANIQNDSSDDPNDLDYCHLNQQEQQQFKCSIALSGNFPQYLTILNSDFHNSSENMHPANTSKCLHGFKAIEVPSSERCQSASSLLTSTPAMDTVALNLSSSLCQLKCNNSHSSLRETCSSSLDVNCTHHSFSSSPVTTVDNEFKEKNVYISDNLLKDHCSSSDDPIANTKSVLETSCVTAVVSGGLNKLQSYSSTIPAANYPFCFDGMMKAENGVNGWVSSPSLTTNSDSSVVNASFNSLSMNSKRCDNKNTEQLCNPIILDSAVTKIQHNTICEQSGNQTHRTSIPKYHHPSSTSHESVANDCVLKDNGSHLVDRQSGFNSNSNNLQGLSPSSSSSDLTSSPSECSSSPSTSSCTTLTHSNRSRCYECNRRTRLACGFSCRCERWFCARHHHPEDHQCNFNFKTMVNSA